MNSLVKKRLVLLGLIFIIRLLPGIIEASKVENKREVIVKGELIKQDQKGSKCQIRVGRFWALDERICQFSQKDKIMLVGTTDKQVIEIILGRIWLKDLTKTQLLGKQELNNDGRVIEGAGFERFREKLLKVYKRLLPEPESSLMGGIVLGQKTSLPYEFYQALLATGTVHIIVASGYNVMVVGKMILNTMLNWINRKKASWLAILGMVIYGLLSGAEPPVVRAVIMGGMVIIGEMLGRRSQAGWGLLLAGWVMVMVQPEMLINISFQLSVMASVGLFWLEPKFREGLSRFEESRVWLARFSKQIVKTELIPTLAAQIMTAPLIFYYFGRVSVIAPVVNMMILPMVPILMAWGGVMLILGLFWQPLGMVVGWLVYGLAHLMVLVIKGFSF